VTTTLGSPLPQIATREESSMLANVIAALRIAVVSKARGAGETLKRLV
jgi:hypothetical protein